MKRIISILLVAVFLLLLTACGDESSTSDNTKKSSSSPESISSENGSDSASDSTPAESSSAESSSAESPAKADVYCDDGSLRESMTAMDFAKDMGIGLNLGNTMEAYYSTEDNKTGGSQKVGAGTARSYEMCWGAIFTMQNSIDGMRDADFGTVRIPVYWGNMMEDDGKFDIAPEYFERVDQIVDYCRKAGLYAVINIHHYDGFIIEHYDQEKVYEITKHLWEQIAEHYKNWSDYVVFEGFNESLGQSKKDVKLSKDEIYDYVNNMNRIFVETVRATGGNNAKRMLIVSGYWTNIDNTSSDKFVLPADTTPERMMVSVHYVDNNMYWGNTIGGQKWLDYIDDQCEKLKKAFTTKNIPVFMGECTATYPDERFAKDAIYTDTSECLSIVLDELVDYGFVPVIWDTCDSKNPGNSFYNRKDCKMSNDHDAAVVRDIADKIKNR